ncbi:feruloyl CoA ortho-hydroxylase F6H1-1-like [Syzygium oleosum]|uniref:feruloyl CoA ortho-hydroxylase F6H1-1-like n=1 Tax=Syzygium oleosum TaxID=219896 RepID=UPI0024BB9E6D|nr:feruloyl CoA ortho-hydroxylase F6H1-1-like [Syzygium oleosum]
MPREFDQDAVVSGPRSLHGPLRIPAYTAADRSAHRTPLDGSFPPWVTGERTGHWLNIFKLVEMLILPASSSISYGVPIDFSAYLTEFQDPDFPHVVFVKRILILTIEIGSSVDPILLRFLAMVFNKSMEHRATVNTTRERISIAKFFNPKLDSEIGRIQSLTTTESPAMFRRIKLEKYVKDYFAQKLNGKSYLETMKLQPEKAVALQGE